MFALAILATVTHSCAQFGGHLEGMLLWRTVWPGGSNWAGRYQEERPGNGDVQHQAEVLGRKLLAPWGS